MTTSKNNVNALVLHVLRKEEKIKYATEMKDDLIAALERFVEDDAAFKALTSSQATVPARLDARTLKGYVIKDQDNSETINLKEAMVDMLVMCATLPDSKVLGTDMFCQPTHRLGLKGKFDEMVLALQVQEGKKFHATMMDIMEQYKDRLSVILDQEEDMFKNAEVDDLEVAMENIATEALQAEWESNHSMIASAEATANSAMDRHDRMAIRLALVEKTKRDGTEDVYTDDNVEEMIESKTLPVTAKEIAKQDRMILQKNNATYFRRKLEDKAILLRELSFKAEQMQMGRVAMDYSFVAMVMRLANRTKAWAEAQARKQLPNRTMAAPYSKRAVLALFNEAAHTLHALGVFKAVYPMREWNDTTKKFDGEEYTFFKKATASDMVSVKTGQNWADDLRIGFYETNDGNARTPVRNGSGE
mgnify:CR=1 FL=1